MTSINPNSDNGLGVYYSKPLNDLRREIMEESQKAIKAKDEEIQKLQERFDKTLQSENQTKDKAFQNYRDQINQYNDSERLKNRQLLEDLKEESDRKIQEQLVPERLLGLGKPVYEKTIDQLNDQLNQQKKDSESLRTRQLDQLALQKQKEINELEKNYEKRIKNLELDNAKKSEEQKLQQNQTLHEMDQRLSQEKRALDQFHPNIENEKNLQDLKNEIQTVQDRKKIDLKNLNDQVETVEKKLMHQQEKNIQDLVENQNQEFNKKDTQVLETTRHLQDLSQKRDAKLAQEFRDLDQNYKEQIDRINKTYESELGNLREHDEKALDHLSEKNSRLLQERDLNNAELVRKTVSENDEKLKSLADHFQNQFDHFEVKKKQDHNEEQNFLKQSLDQKDETDQATLKAQKNAYEKDSAAQHKKAEHEIKTLHDELQKIKNSASPTDFSPIAEERVRKSIGSEYEKAFKIERERNAAAQESLRSKLAESTKDLILKQQDRENELQRSYSFEKAREEAQAVNYALEVESEANLKVAQSENQRLREKDQLIKQFARIMEQQKAAYDREMKALLETSSAKASFNSIDSDFKYKLAHRELSNKQTDAVRAAEKKLLDEKLEHEFEVSELRAQAASELKDLERKSKLILEETVQDYTNRLKTQESRSLERERNITQNFQDEIERMKKAYEFALKKKS